MKYSKILQLITVIFLLSASQAYAAIAVIVHPSNTSTLSPSDIAKIFTSKQKTFSSGEEAIPVDAPLDAETRNAFIAEILGKSNSQMKAYWAKLVFSGKGSPPRELSSDADIIALVGKNPSIIGYVDAASVDASVKVIHQF